MNFSNFMEIWLLSMVFGVIYRYAWKKLKDKEYMGVLPFRWDFACLLIASIVIAPFWAIFLTIWSFFSRREAVT